MGDGEGEAPPPPPPPPPIPSSLLSTCVHVCTNSLPSLPGSGFRVRGSGFRFAAVRAGTCKQRLNSGRGSGAARQDTRGGEASTSGCAGIPCAGVTALTLFRGACTNPGAQVHSKSGAARWTPRGAPARGHSRTAHDSQKSGHLAAAAATAAPDACRRDASHERCTPSTRSRSRRRNDEPTRRHSVLCYRATPI